MVSYEKYNVSELQNYLHEKGLIINSSKLKKSYLIFLLNNLVNDSLQINPTFFGNECFDEIESLKECIQNLNNEIIEKNCQINRLNSSPDSYKILALEAEEALNKKIYLFLLFLKK